MAALKDPTGRVLSRGWSLAALWPRSASDGHSGASAAQPSPCSHNKGLCFASGVVVTHHLCVSLPLPHPPPAPPPPSSPPPPPPLPAGCPPPSSPPSTLTRPPAPPPPPRTLTPAPPSPGSQPASRSSTPPPPLTLTLTRPQATAAAARMETCACCALRQLRPHSPAIAHWLLPCR